MPQRQCKNEGCERDAENGRRVCRACRARADTVADPERVAYHKLKSRAKKRGIVFYLTLEQFREFCTQHNYINAKGRTATGYHIDRIDESKGYYLGNLQVLTNTDNITKSNNYRAYRRLLRRWCEVGGAGPVPEFVPATRKVKYEYYKNQLLNLYYEDGGAQPSLPPPHPHYSYEEMGIVPRPPDTPLPDEFYLP